LGHLIRDSGPSDDRSQSLGNDPVEEWDLRCAIVGDLIRGTVDQNREPFYLFFENFTSPLELCTELSDVLYGWVGGCLLAAFRCTDFTALEKKEAGLVGHAPLVRALSCGGEKCGWTGLPYRRSSPF
jgi:hypothetical protein